MVGNLVVMIKKPKSKAPTDKPLDVQDEPGAQARFLRGVRKALNMPHRAQKEGRGDKRKSPSTGAK